VTRLDTFSSCRRAVVGRSFAVIGCFGTISGGTMPISLRPQENILVGGAGVIVEIVETGQLVTPLCATIAKRSRSIAILRRLDSHRGRLVAHRRHEVTVPG
jgi:hypothetical protein